MRLINGRTPDQWRAFDRGKLIVSLALAAVLILMWLAGRGPGGAAACCAVPAEAATAAPVTAATPTAAPATTSPPATTAPVPPPAEDDCPGTIDADVTFASNSARLNAAGMEVLARLAPCLAEGRFEVAGHADSSGSDAINDPLAEARARAVVDFIVSQGVDAGRVGARGYGSTRPLADNATAEGRARNRRVEIHDR